MATQVMPKMLVVDGRVVSWRDLRVLFGSTPPGPAARESSLDRLAAALRALGVDARVGDEGSAPACPSESDRASQAITLLNAIGEGVCLGDAQGRILWSNDFFAGLEPDVQSEVAQNLQAAAEWFSRTRVSHGAGSAALECKFEVPSASSGRWYEVYVTPAPPRSEEDGDLGERAEHRVQAADRAAAEGAERLAGVVRDVTTARRAALKLDAIERAGSELMQLDAAAVRDKNTMDRIRLLEQKIVRLTREVLHYDHFAIFLIDEAPGREKRLELVVSAGLPEEIQDLHLAPEVTGSGTCGFVAATGESYICRDVSSDDRYLPGLVGAQSSLTVPLKLNEQVIGAMTVESNKRDAFDDEERQFLEIFARHIALALHMLDLLVVERSATNKSVSGRVGEEISEPLGDILGQLDQLLEIEGRSPADIVRLDRIRADVESIKARIENVTSGPQTLLGVEKAMSERTADPFLSGKRILVADDAVKIRKIVDDVLTGKGCIVVACEDGGLACAALARVERGELPPFDLVLSDIRMPDRNGYEVFAASKKATPSCPVILMTGFGYDPHHSIVRASQQGLAAVLYKPFEIDRMMDEVRKALGCEVPAR